MNSKDLVNSAVLALLALGVTGNARAAADPMEKCAGIVKAGKNDCATATSSCAGVSKKDSDKDAWINLPKGTCNKIVGGKVLSDAQAKKADQSMKK